MLLSSATTLLLVRRAVGTTVGTTARHRKRALSSSREWGEDQHQQPPPPPSSMRHDEEDPFVILEVSIDADERTIKSAFRKLAKQLHPDAAPKHERGSAAKAKEFHKIVRAYEVLSDPTLKAAYILKRRPHQHHLRRRPTGAGGAMHATAKGPSPVDAFNASLRKGRRRSARRRAGLYDDAGAVEQEEGEAAAEEGAWTGPTSWKTLSQLEPGLFRHLEQEFEDAMIHAYLGPRVEANTIPWAFEAEERRRPPPRPPQDKEDEQHAVDEPLHPHILQITSGQQLLGFVEAAPLSVDSLLSAIPVVEEEEKEEGKDESELSLRSQLAGLSSVDDKSNYGPLRLVWQDTPLARSTRLWDTAKKEDVIVVQTEAGEQTTAAAGPQANGSDNTDNAGAASPAKMYLIRGLDNQRLLSSHQIRDAASGELTHVLISHRTPLVAHLHLLQAEGGVECRVSKGELKNYIPSDMWHFAPRSKDHDAASWYLERADAKGLTKAQRYLPPAVIMMCCAYKTLDKEAREEEKRRQQSVSTRLTALAKDFMGKLM